MATRLHAPTPTRRPVCREGPLSITQEQLWTLDRRGAPPAALNLSYALAIDGPLDAVALRAALDDVVARHEPLRTTYAETHGAPVALVGAAEPEASGGELEPEPVRDLEEAAVHARAEREHGYDLEHEGPLRVRLLRLAPDRHVLLLTLHHIAGDGWSLRLLGEDLSRAYAARLRGAAPEPPEPSGDCIDYATGQRAWLAGPAPEIEAGWWADRLRGASAHLPGLDAETREPCAELVRHVAVLPDERSAALRAFARSAGVSPFGVLLTAFGVLVARWSDCADPLVGTLAANRTTALGGSVLGAHYNPLLLDVDVSGDPTLAECVLRTGRTTLATLDHQALPYELLAERLAPELGWDVARVPAAMLLLDRYPLEALELEGCRVTGLYLDDGPAADRIEAATTAGLTFFVREVGDRLTLSAFHPAAGPGEPAVSGLMDGYAEILEALTESPELPVGELALPFDAPPRTSHAAAGEPRGLREVTGAAPAEALSPVGAGWIGE